MNTQFATQRLLSEEPKASDVVGNILDQLDADEQLIAYFVKAVELGYLTPERAIEIFKQTTGLDEMTGSGAVGGGSTTGGGTTAGATFTPGAGEQYASTKAFKGTRKKKYQEGTFEDDEIAIFDSGEDGLTKIYKKADGSFYGVNDNFDFTAKDKQELLRKVAMWGYDLIAGTIHEDAPRLAGSPAKTTKQGARNLSAYSSVGFTKAPSAEQAGKQIEGVQVKQLWKEGDGSVDVSWSMIEDEVKMLGKRDLGIEPNTPDEARFLNYMKEAFKEGLIRSYNDLLHTVHGYNEPLKESRRYSQFKKEAAIRSKPQQMHEAVKMVNKKLEEIAKLLEFTQQMRQELSEGEELLEYHTNTKKLFEKVHSRVVEIYSKTKKLK